MKKIRRSSPSLSPAEVVVDNPYRRGESVPAVVAEDWSGLALEERPVVDTGALFRLVGIIVLTDRKRDDAIRQFASAYGAMGKAEALRASAMQTTNVKRAGTRTRTARTSIVGSSRTTATREIRGEPIQAWYDTIGKLRRACAILDRLGLVARLRGTSLLEEHLLFFNALADMRKREETKHVTIVDLTRSQKSAILRDELRKMVLRNLTSDAMQPFVIGDSIPMRLEWHPTTLRAALWIEVARLMERAEPIRYRRCAECPNLLVFTGNRRTGRRAGSRFCSDACSQRAYRKRRQHARTLHAKGRTDADIVAELGIESDGTRSAREIVRGWVKPRRR